MIAPLDKAVATVSALTGTPTPEVISVTNTLTSLVARMRAGEDGPQWFAKVCPAYPAPAIQTAHRAELDFYGRVLPLLAADHLAPPMVGLDAEAPSVLVLADLGASRYALPYPIPGRARHARSAVAALALLHRTGLTAVDAAKGHAEPHDVDLERFLHDHRRWLPTTYVGRIERARVAGSSTRRASRETVLHGDPHFANMLFPVERDEMTAVLCDWQHWRIGSPGHDLATVLGLHGHGSAIRPWPWLRLYYDLHSSGGPSAWTLDELVDDYRHCVVGLTVSVPAWQASIGLDVNVWWPLLERGMRAWTGARCDELV